MFWWAVLGRRGNVGFGVLVVVDSTVLVDVDWTELVDVDWTELVNFDSIELVDIDSTELDVDWTELVDVEPKLDVLVVVNIVLVELSIELVNVVSFLTFNSCAWTRDSKKQMITTI